MNILVQCNLMASRKKWKNFRFGIYFDPGINPYPANVENMVSS